MGRTCCGGSRPKNNPAPGTGKVIIQSTPKQVVEPIKPKTPSKSLPFVVHKPK